MYRDNNWLAYVRESKLEMAQIRWLSKCTLFDFDVKYRTGKLNKAEDTLSCHPFIPEEMDSVSDSEDYKTISYATVCKELEAIFNWEKPLIDCKVANQDKCNKPAKQDLELHSSVI